MGFRDTVINREPPPEEAADCLRECAQAQGASCYRISRAFTPRTADRRDRDARDACRVSFLLRACQLGMAQACKELKASCGNRGDWDERAAFARLESACEPSLASWECFYLAHSTEMMWGTPLRPRAQTLALFQRVCAASCPPPPERCFRRQACERVHTLRAAR